MTDGIQSVRYHQCTPLPIGKVSLVVHSRVNWCSSAHNVRETVYE